MFRLFFCLMFLFLLNLKSIYSQVHLVNRYTILSDDKRCQLSDDGNWKLLSVPNGTLLNVTDVSGATAQYKPEFDDFSGIVEVKVYKYKWDKKLDKKIKVEIKHSGRVEEKYIDLSTIKDSWFSLGKYMFDGRSDEFVRFTRISKDESITPIPMIRFDLYYNTQTRLQTESEKKLKLQLGYSEIGKWNTTLSVGYYKSEYLRTSDKKNAACIWNPGNEMTEGKYGVYVFKPNIGANDKYEIYHNGKVDAVYLKNLKYSNLDLYNPVTKAGWYKIGEFDFSGRGNEFVKLVKSSNKLLSFADCLYFENINFDGTILNRIVVTTKKSGQTYLRKKRYLTLSQKVKLTKIPIGFYPTLNEEDIQTSSKFGSTIYSRAYFIKNTSKSYFWNPCIIEPGDYEILYYNYWNTKGNGTFKIFHSNKKKIVQKKDSQFVKDSFLSLGSFFFSGKQGDEYIEMTGIDRASDITFQKKIANGALLKQIVVTGHPYFKELSFEDTRGIDGEHAISFLVQKGIFPMPTGNKFRPYKPVTIKEFVKSLLIILRSQHGENWKNDIKIKSDKISESDFKKGLLYFPPNSSNLIVDSYVSREIAAQLLMNAMEMSGKYLNVKNIFCSSPKQILAKYNDYQKVSRWCREAFAKSIETEVLKPTTPNYLSPKIKLSRANAAIILKDFYENILGSGPPNQWDWELTFNDEFNGNGVDWTKWKPEAAVRFQGLSAKWGENCVVENGILKGYTYMDNRGAPYSSGCISSLFLQRYGFFEARYKYPNRAYGSHTSFWTSSKGGDFNYNEGTYPNGVSNNNYFMTSRPVAGLGKGIQANFNNFNISTNFAHDFHTVSGFLDENNLTYGLDGGVTYAVNNYPLYYKDSTRTTNVPYSLTMSTVITYFDGPLDRDRIDGSFMAVDWIRAYQKTVWNPEFLPELSFPYDGAIKQTRRIEPILRFNKEIDKIFLNSEMISVVNLNGGKVPSYSLTQITPLRVRIKFNQKLEKLTRYQIIVRAGLTDTKGNKIRNSGYLFFTTGSD